MDFADLLSMAQSNTKPLPRPSGMLKATAEVRKPKKASTSTYRDNRPGVSEASVANFIKAKQDAKADRAKKEMDERRALLQKRLDEKKRKKMLEEESRMKRTLEGIEASQRSLADKHKSSRVSSTPGNMQMNGNNFPGRKNAPFPREMNHTKPTLSSMGKAPGLSYQDLLALANKQETSKSEPSRSSTPNSNTENVPQGSFKQSNSKPSKYSSSSEANSLKRKQMSSSTESYNRSNASAIQKPDRSKSSILAQYQKTVPVPQPNAGSVVKSKLSLAPKMPSSKSQPPPPKAKCKPESSANRNTYGSSRAPAPARPMSTAAATRPGPVQSSSRPLSGGARTGAGPPPAKLRGIAAQLGFSQAARNKYLERQREFEEEDYDSDLDDFINDDGSDLEECADYRGRNSEVDDVMAELRKITGYDPTKYKDDHMSDWELRRSMETSYKDIVKEEKRSERLGMKEDAQEFRKEQERMKKKMEKKSSKHDR